MPVQSFDRENMSAVWQSDEEIVEAVHVRVDIGKSPRENEIDDGIQFVGTCAERTDLDGTIFTAY